MRDIIANKIIEIIKYVHDDAYKIEPYNSIIEDLRIPSLEVMVIIGEIEEEFQIVIPTDELRGFVTINDIAVFIDSVLKNSNY